MPNNLKFLKLVCKAIAIIVLLVAIEVASNLSLEKLMKLSYALSGLVSYVVMVPVLKGCALSDAYALALASAVALGFYSAVLDLSFMKRVALGLGLVLVQLAFILFQHASWSPVLAALVTLTVPMVGSFISMINQWIDAEEEEAAMVHTTPPLTLVR